MGRSSAFLVKPSYVEYPVEPEDWPGKLYPAWQLEIEDGDHMRLDEQGLD